MLLRPDATFMDPVLKRHERLFPQGIDASRFESALPQKEVFANSVLDPAIGLAGDLALQTFAAADWQNWVSTAKISLYEVGTRIGLPPLDDTGLATGVGMVYANIEKSVSALRQFQDPSELVPELIKNAGLQILQQLAGSNMIAQTVAQVLAAAAWAIDVVAAHKNSMLAKDVALPPLQSEDPATDTWQVNRAYEVFRSRGSGGLVYPDGGVEPASNADYTQFFLPAYRSNQPWMIQHRATGLVSDARDYACKCPQDLGYPTRTACGEALKPVGTDERDCLFAVLDGHEEEAKAYLDCANAAYEQYVDCLVDNVNCTEGWYDECTADHEAAVAACPQLSVTVEASVTACTT